MNKQYEKWFADNTQTASNELEEMMRDILLKFGDSVWQAATKSAVPNVIFQLSSDAKDSLCAMLEYCLENGIGMGMDEGIMDFDSGDKYSFRLELEELCNSLAAAHEVTNER